MTSPTTDRRYGLASGIAIKAPVAAMAAGNIALQGEQTIDGVAVHAVNSAGIPDRVLCAGQTDSTQNGIYDVSTAFWTRSIDANGNHDLRSGTLVQVNGGTLYGYSAWQVTGSDPIIVGTTAMTWIRGGIGQDAKLRSDLAASTGAGIVGWIRNAVGAVFRWVSDKLMDTISVFDFMTTAQIADVRGGTALIDVTAPIAAALSAMANIGVANGGVKLKFPKGIYLCNVGLVGTLNNSMGEYGVCLSGYGATLKGRASDTSIITGNGAIATTPDPFPGGTKYVNGTTIEGFTLDMSLMANSAACYAMAFQHAYNSTIRDVHVIGEPNLGGGLFLGSQCYTWSVDSLHCARVQIKGYNSTTNLSSSMTFKGLVANQVILTNFFTAAFTGGVIQGGLDHFVFNSAQNITVTGMDLEGPNTGECVYNFTGGAKDITSIGNSPGGYDHNTYSKGIALNSSLADRPKFAGNTIGTYGRVNSPGSVSVVGSNVSLASVAITGTAGQFSCTASTIAVGMGLTIFGTAGGTGSITGYTNTSTLYYVIATNGTTTFTLSATPNGPAIATTAGTPTGLTYLLYNSPVPIYCFSDVTAGSACGLFAVTGDNGNWGFSDLLMVGYNTVAVLSSNTMYGSPGTRAYSYLSTTTPPSLNLSLNSSNVAARCVGMEYLS